jgi:predicted MFS family arabinose efflux permease
MNDPKVEVAQAAPRCAASKRPPDDRPPPGARSRQRFPWSALLAMALTGFVVIMTETIPAGLLPQLADGLSVSQAAAGQLVGAYALGTVVAAIPAVAITRGMDRKPVLVIGILGFVATNTATAIAGNYPSALVARLIAGAFSGLLWGMLAGYARSLVPPQLAGKGLAVAMAGTPVALSIGTPLGSFAGSAAGWRWTFAAMSITATALLAWVLAVVPNRPGQAREGRTPVLRALLIPGVRPVLAVVFTWMLAHNILYTYAAPFLANSGVPGRVDAVLLVFGLAALVGIWCTGMLIDKALRRLVLASLGGFGLAALGFAFADGAAFAFYAATVAWGLAFGGAATQLQTASADAAGADADVAQAMITAVWNLAIFGGAAVGGALLATAGAGSIPWALIVLIAIALTIVGIYRRHAFPPGPRQQPTDHHVHPTAQSPDPVTDLQ